MSIAEKVIEILGSSGLGLSIEAGKYPDRDYPICGKVIFAGGMGVSEEDRPRNVMGGNPFRAEIFKIILRGAVYIGLEKEQVKVTEALRNSGFIQLSGLEHIDTKELDGEKLLQLAVTFKSTKQI